MGLWDLFGSSEPEEFKDDTIRSFECDYDKDCTPLYAAIEEREWLKIADFLNTGKWRNGAFDLFAPTDSHSPERQTRTWVTRYRRSAPDDDDDDDDDEEEDENAVVKWTQLPLHAAITFGAPPKLVEILLTLYPHAARCADNMLRLPLHLAMMAGSDDIILRLLVERYPAAISKKDAKGKIPTLMTGPRRHLVRIIEEHVEYTTELLDKQYLKDVEIAKAEMEKKVLDTEEIVKEAQVRTKESEDAYLAVKAERDALQQQIDNARAEIEAAHKAIEYQTSKKHVAMLQCELNDARDEALAKLELAANAGRACSGEEDGRQEGPWSENEIDTQEDMLCVSPMAKLPTTPSVARMTQQGVAMKV